VGRCKEAMRYIQTIGAILSCIAIALFCLGVYPVSPNSPDKQVIQAGWLFTYIVTPMFYASALFVIPSTFALFSSNLRNKYNITGKPWQALWVLNILISLVFIVLFGVSYLLL